MVEQGATKEEASSGAHGDGSVETKVAQGNETFKKKNTKSNSEKIDGYVSQWLETDLTCN